MIQNIFPDYSETDPIYITAFGIDRQGDWAFWGPGRRTEGIVHYVLRGRGVFNGNVVTRDQGFYIPPHSLCEYYPDKDDPWGYFWINCSEDMANRYLLPTLKPDQNGIFAYDFKGKLLSVCDKIFASSAGMSSVEALGYAFSILSLHTPPKEIAGPLYHVRRAKNFIESNINKKLTVCEVADAIGIHDRYLYALFVQYEGISPKEYVLRRKMDTASDLLEHTALSVMEVAAAVGFPDVYSFSRLFKVKQGLSPLQYRNRLRR